jgi:uncharacterized protein YbcI
MKVSWLRSSTRYSGDRRNASRIAWRAACSSDRSHSPASAIVVVVPCALTVIPSRLGTERGVLSRSVAVVISPPRGGCSAVEESIGSLGEAPTARLRPSPVPRVRARDYHEQAYQQRRSGPQAYEVAIAVCHTQSCCSTLRRRVGWQSALSAARRLSLFPAWGHTQGKARKVVMTSEIDTERQPGVSLRAEISTAIVRLLREYTGRGPMKAQTTIRDNVVLVMLEQALTKGEQVLVAKGRGENVLALRHEYQEAMRDESSAKIAELTGRNVTAMMSANHLDPDLGAEIYVLDRAPDHHGGALHPSTDAPTFIDGEAAEASS